MLQISIHKFPYLVPRHEGLTNVLPSKFLSESATSRRVSFNKLRTSSEGLYTGIARSMNNNGGERIHVGEATNKCTAVGKDMEEKWLARVYDGSPSPCWRLSRSKVIL